MTERIILRAKFDPTVEIAGTLIHDGDYGWVVRLAKGTSGNTFSKVEWALTKALPTARGTVFDALLKGWDTPHRFVTRSIVSGDVSYHFLNTGMKVEASRIDLTTVEIKLTPPA